MDYTTEVQTKLERLRAIMDQYEVGAVWLRQVNSVAWITGGIDTAVNVADTAGIASVVVTANTAAMWTNTIEAPRLRAEDHVEERGFELRVTPWEQAQGVEINGTLGVDIGLDGTKDLSGAIAGLRARLLPVEQERFRKLSTSCAEAMHHAINRVRPGITEYEIAAGLEYETRSRNAVPIVTLIAVDDRIHKVRHPIPTGKIMEKYAMLVLCGRRDGLVCSVTRLIHFGALPDDLRRRMQATAEVDAAMIAASQPGTTLEDIFTITQEAYARVGYDGEWKLHHQGGLAGYAARELLAVPGEKTALEEGMVCAWNPSITGAKCEDSVMVTAAGQPTEVLTPMYGWPVASIEVNGTTYERPLIMEVNEG
ncbi:MAG: M24 family metallopeptidase [Anaerolineae bacterium]|nr:M24 family metallopeptidase [Anaerolineae bacterium]